MLMVFLTSCKRLAVDILPNGQKYDQDDLLQKVIPDLKPERSRFARLKILVEFASHIDNSMCHNGTKMTNTLDKASHIRARHPVNSPDLSPRDFWLFGMPVHRMTDRQPQRPKAILDAVPKLCDKVTFEESENVFLTWMEQLPWIIQNGREHVTNKSKFDVKIFRIDEIGDGISLLFATLHF
jgi:hypothetical protein